MESYGIKQVLGLFYKNAPDEIGLDDGESVDDAIGRLRESLKNLSNENPTFWNLALISRMKTLVNEHMTSCIEEIVEKEMLNDPSWMLSSQKATIDVTLEKLLTQHPVVYMKIQRQISDKVSTEVRAISDHMQKYIRTASDLHHILNDCSKMAVIDSPPKNDRMTTHKDADVFNLDNLGDDDWCDSSQQDDETSTSIGFILERLCHNSISARAEAFHRLHQLPMDTITRSDSLQKLCKSLIACFFHGDAAERSIGFYWKVFLATEDISTQCNLYIDLLSTLFTHPGFNLRKQSVIAPPHHHHPQNQRALLCVYRMLQLIIDHIPTQWIYMSNELRTQVMLITCQLFGDINGSVIGDSTADSIVPVHCAMAWLDCQSRWFVNWTRRSPNKEQWLWIVHDSSLLEVSIARFAFCHDVMELWRKIETAMIPSHNLSRKRSAKQHIIHPPQSTEHTYSSLMQKSFLQVIFILLEILPKASIKKCFPMTVKNPYKEPRRESIAHTLTHHVVPNESSNNLIFRQVQAPSSPSPTRLSSDNTGILSAHIKYNEICLHIALICILEGWTSDLWDDPRKVGPEAWIRQLEALLISQKHLPTCLAILDVIEMVLQTGERFSKPPSDVSGFRFPYMTSQIFESKSILEQFASHLSSRITTTSNQRDRLTQVVAPMIVRTLVRGFSPTKQLCSRLCQFLAMPWTTNSIVREISMACESPNWFLMFHRESFHQQIDVFLSKRSDHDDCTMETIISFCTSAHGLIHFHQFIPQNDSTWFTFSQNHKRTWRYLDSLTIIPSIPKAWIDSMKIRVIWRNAFHALSSNIEGLEALYGSLDESPYSLRQPLEIMNDFWRLCTSQYIPSTQMDLLELFPLQFNRDVHDYIIAKSFYHLSKTLDGARYVHERYNNLIPPCTCRINPCISDPISSFYHSITESIKSVGGNFEFHRDQWPNIPSSRSFQSLSDGDLRDLNMKKQLLLAAINSSSSYLDFDKVVDIIWDFISRIESTTTWISPELTSWFGDIIYQVVCCGKSRLDESKLNDTRKPLSYSDSDIEWANKWIKTYSYTIQCIDDPLGCSTILPRLFQEYRKEMYDPFPWTCLMLFIQRYNENEIKNFFTTIRNRQISLYLWSTRTETIYNDVKIPIVRLAAAVEWIISMEFPHILLALERCQVTIVSCILRWQHQCFWNYLNWREIIIYITLISIQGHESNVYFFVVLFKHMNLSTMTTEGFTSPIPSLKWSMYRGLMERLHREYYDFVEEILKH